MPLRRLRVLIVDDDPAAREVLCHALSQGGVDVVALAADGLEGIALARALRPDVVLMDVVMGDMGGVEATGRIARELPEIDCVLLTATPESQASVSSIEAGAAAYLPKSLVDVRRLPQTLRAICEPGAVARRRARRLALSLRADFPDLLGDPGWLALELAAGGEAPERAEDLLGRLASTGDPRVGLLAAAIATD